MLEILSPYSALAQNTASEIPDLMNSVQCPQSTIPMLAELSGLLPRQHRGSSFPQ